LESSSAFLEWGGNQKKRWARKLKERKTAAPLGRKKNAFLSPGLLPHRAGGGKGCACGTAFGEGKKGKNCSPLVSPSNTSAHTRKKREGRRSKVDRGGKKKKKRKKTRVAGGRSCLLPLYSTREKNTKLPVPKKKRENTLRAGFWFTKKKKTPRKTQNSQKAKGKKKGKGAWKISAPGCFPHTPQKRRRLAETNFTGGGEKRGRIRKEKEKSYPRHPAQEKVKTNPFSSERGRLVKEGRRNSLSSSFWLKGRKEKEGSDPKKETNTKRGFQKEKKRPVRNVQEKKKARSFLLESVVRPPGGGGWDNKRPRPPNRGRAVLASSGGEEKGTAGTRGVSEQRKGKKKENV